MEAIDKLLDAVKWEKIEGELEDGPSGMPVATHRGILKISGL